MAEVWLPQHDKLHQATDTDAAQHLGAASLELVVNNAANTEPEQTVRFRDLEIEVHPENFTGNGVIAGSTSNNISKTIRIINDVCAQQLGWETNYRAHNPALNSTYTSFFMQKVKVGGEATPRKQLTNITAAANATRQELRTVNHPVEQVLKSVSNALFGHVPNEDIEHLTNEVLRLTCWPQLRLQLLQQVSAKRQSSL